MNLRSLRLLLLPRVSHYTAIKAQRTRARLPTTCADLPADPASDRSRPPPPP